MAKKQITEAAKLYQAVQYDPTMLQVNLLIKNSKMPLTTIAKRCGVSTRCIRNWLDQKTRRPQALTMKFVLQALGYDLRIVPSKGHNRPPED